MDCTFEDDFKCGYRQLSGKTAVQWSATRVFSQGEKSFTIVKCRFGTNMLPTRSFTRGVPAPVLL